MKNFLETQQRWQFNDLVGCVLYDTENTGIVLTWNDECDLI